MFGGVDRIDMREQSEAPSRGERRVRNLDELGLHVAADSTVVCTQKAGRAAMNQKINQASVQRKSVVAGADHEEQLGSRVCAGKRRLSCAGATCASKEQAGDLFGKQNWTESRTKSSCSTGKPTGALLVAARVGLPYRTEAARSKSERKESIDDTHPLEGKDKAKQS